MEGISENRGDITPLDEIYKLKEKYKYRMVLDESLSLGVLGATGRGAAEHFDLKPGQVELVAASMGTIAFTSPACSCSYDCVPATGRCQKADPCVLVTDKQLVDAVLTY